MDKKHTNTKIKFTQIPKMILCVDDDAFNIQAIEVLINQCKKKGIKSSVIYASNGREAVDEVKNGIEKLLQCQQRYGKTTATALYGHIFGLILMDCNMPIMDGFEATDCIRQLHREYGL